ncbi:MAG: hypothetical protein ACI4BH_07310, partial [Muribaculaceae bacterium]
KHHFSRFSPFLSQYGGTILRFPPFHRAATPRNFLKMNSLHHNKKARGAKKPNTPLSPPPTRLTDLWHPSSSEVAL